MNSRAPLSFPCLPTIWEDFRTQPLTLLSFILKALAKALFAQGEYTEKSGRRSASAPSQHRSQEPDVAI